MRYTVLDQFPEKKSLVVNNPWSNTPAFDVSDDPTNIVRYKYRLRKNEPAELTYISEIGMYGGDVLVEQTPFVTIDGVAKKGTLFSYKYFNPPIDKYTGGILEFVWTINFLRG